MGTTWRERDTIDDDGDDSPTVTAWNGQVDIDLREPPPADLSSAGAAMVDALVHIAAAGVDDRTAQVLLRCWSTATSPSFAASAVSLSASSRRLRGLADARVLSVVDRWIDDLAPVRRQRRTGLRPLLSRTRAKRPTT